MTDRGPRRPSPALCGDTARPALAAIGGDFALAAWDAGKQRGLVAVDRIGIQPLFHAEVGGALAFASTLDGLARFPGVDTALSPQADLRLPLLSRVPGTGHDLPRRAPTGRRPLHRVSAPVRTGRPTRTGRCASRRISARSSRVLKADFVDVLQQAVRDAAGDALLRHLPVRRDRQFHGHRHAGARVRQAGASLLDRLRRRRLRRDGVRTHRRASLRRRAPRVLRHAGRRREGPAAHRRLLRPAVRQRLSDPGLLLREVCRRARRHTPAGRRRRRRAVRRQRAIWQAARARPVPPIAFRAAARVGGAADARSSRCSRCPACARSAATSSRRAPRCRPATSPTTC